MNAIPADGDGWVAPGPVGRHPRRARRGRHGAGGLLRPGGRAARRVPRRRASTWSSAPATPTSRRSARVGRAVWPRLAAGRRPRDPRLDPAPAGPRRASWPSASARRSTCSTAPAWRPRREAFRRPPAPDVTIAYSVKSNPLMGLVARLHRAGCWAEVASGFEYRVARRAGVPGSQIVFNGPLKTTAELRRALRGGRDGRSPTASSRCARSPRWPRAAAPGARVGLRAGARPTGRARDRFGVPARTRARRRRRCCARAGLRADRPPHPPRRLPARPAAADRARRSTASPCSTRCPSSRFAAAAGAPARDRPSGSAASSGSTSAAAGRARPGSAPTSTRFARRWGRCAAASSWSPAGRWCATRAGC